MSRKMTKYIALLRGINVGGKNKISMTELKVEFSQMGFKNVVTYINSGNVIFESDLEKAATTTACEKLIEAAFGLKIAVLILTAAELLDVTAHAPKWWKTTEETCLCKSKICTGKVMRAVTKGRKTFRNNTEGVRNDALFLIPPMTVSEFLSGIGEIKHQYESIAYYGNIIFWTTQIANFNRASISKLAANKKLFNAVTIRNANTTMKLAELVRHYEGELR